MEGRPVPGDPEFWAYAQGDSGFARWLARVDELCLRFIDQDLLSVPMLDLSDHMDPQECYERGITPNMYFIEILEHLKTESGIDLIDRYVAQQAKWGSVCPFLKR